MGVTVGALPRASRLASAPANPAAGLAGTSLAPELWVGMAPVKIVGVKTLTPAVSPAAPTRPKPRAPHPASDRRPILGVRGERCSNASDRGREREPWRQTRRF